ncbi:hypothetical protein ScPMuIL_005763 [Solemya velum]
MEDDDVRLYSFDGCNTLKSCIQEELEVLEAIYIDELTILRNDSGELSSIKLQLHPSTGDDQKKKYVCLTLAIKISTHYPDEIPGICITNPRGLGEEEIYSLQKDLEKLALERKGSTMLFELIELAKESLTEGNHPKCACMICLEHFKEGQDFTKTDCYHYFHSKCLSRYITHCIDSKEAEKMNLQTNPLHEDEETEGVLCPVCRKEIAFEMDNLPLSKPSVDETQHFIPSESLKKWQREMSNTLERQRASGGVIDVNLEKNKFLVTEDERIQIRGENFESNYPEDTLSRDRVLTDNGKGRKLIAKHRQKGQQKDGYNDKLKLHHSKQKITKNHNWTERYPRSGAGSRNTRPIVRTSEKNISKCSDRELESKNISASLDSRTRRGCYSAETALKKTKPDLRMQLEMKGSSSDKSHSDDEVLKTLSTLNVESVKNLKQTTQVKEKAKYEVKAVDDEKKHQKNVEQFQRGSSYHNSHNSHFDGPSDARGVGGRMISQISHRDKHKCSYTPEDCNDDWNQGTRNRKQRDIHQDRRVDKDHSGNFINKNWQSNSRKVRKDDHHDSQEANGNSAYIPDTNNYNNHRQLFERQREDYSKKYEGRTSNRSVLDSNYRAEYEPYREVDNKKGREIKPVNRAESGGSGHTLDSFTDKSKQGLGHDMSIEYNETTVKKEGKLSSESSSPQHSEISSKQNIHVGRGRNRVKRKEVEEKIGKGFEVKHKGQRNVKPCKLAAKYLGNGLPNSNEVGTKSDHPDAKTNTENEGIDCVMVNRKISDGSAICRVGVPPGFEKLTAAKSTGVMPPPGFTALR